MTKAIMDAIQHRLLADNYLTLALGGSCVYMSEIMQTNRFPSITLRLNSERSKNRVGYSTYKKRDNTSILQCDIWSKRSRQETYELADILDEIMMSPSVPNTQCWLKVSDGNMYEEDTKIYHKPMRYSFEYIVTDT